MTLSKFTQTFTKYSLSGIRQYTIVRNAVYEDNLFATLNATLISITIVGNAVYEDNLFATLICRHSGFIIKTIVKAVGLYTLLKEHTYPRCTCQAVCITLLYVYIVKLVW